VGEQGLMALRAADGADFSAAYALPAVPARVGVVILPDVRGLHPYYVALAQRFAEAGIAAVALDYFGRTAGLVGDAGTRPHDFDFRSHVPRTTPEGIDDDITAAIGFLRGHAGGSLPVVSVGFCFGGSHSWRQAGGALDIAGCVGFYGKPSVVGEAAADRASRPTVMIIAGADAATPVQEQLRLAERMRAAGAEVDAVVYDGAPHSFFDRASGDWADACRDAWLHVLALTDRVAAA
jgi:carboxymethylenebutenolidase